MNVRNRLVLPAGAVLTVLFSSCASVYAPSGWLPDPEDVPSDVYGSWIDATAGEEVLRGEMIALNGDTLFVLDSTLHAVGTADILKARVVVFNSEAAMRLGTAFGVLSAPFLNGFYLVVTVPVWLIGGTIAASSRSFDPIIDYPERPLKALAPYARFPQGLPPDVDRSTLQAKVPAR